MLASAEVTVSAYLQPYRPWLSLYGLRLRKTLNQLNDEDMAPIQRLLPPEMMCIIFRTLPPYSLAISACVCKQWKLLSEAPVFWESACQEAFASNSAEKNKQLLHNHYGGSWKRMFVQRPHLRFDGVYVSRNTYFRTGVVEWNVKNAVHLVVYFRYFRFFPDGSLLYRTSPHSVARVARSLMKLPAKMRRDDTLMRGRYIVRGHSVVTAGTYPSCPSTEMRCRLHLRSTTPGANNRIDVKQIVTFDTHTRVALPEDVIESEDEALGGEGALQHRRGMQTFVFIPWHAVATHVLNLPLDKLDVWIPG